MRKSSKRKTGLALLLLLVLCAVLAVLLMRRIAPKLQEPSAAETARPVETSQTPAPAEAPSVPTADPAEDAEKIRIRELMIRNKATLRDEDGDFSDWIELENVSDSDLDLTGWKLGDGPSRKAWEISGLVLPAGGRTVIFASGKNRPGHTDFSLSEGETLSLYNRHGYLVQTVECPEGETDRAWIPGENGAWVESLYPTPGYPNTAEGYLAFQNSLRTESPLLINEAVVANRTGRWYERVGKSDWVELKNVSDTALELSDYYLSDDSKEPFLYQLPEKTLEPGELYVIRCDKESDGGGYYPVCAEFALSATAEHLYLSRADGSLADYVSLRDIPYLGSYGRMSGENGWFYFASSTPGWENEDGRRRVSAMPRPAEPDGVFDGKDSVTVTLLGDGVIYYTTDGSVPTPDSPLYENPILMEKTGIIRAIALENDGLPSRTLTLSYFLNENHTLPVLSLVTDNGDFDKMYKSRSKDMEARGSLSLYEESGSFTIPCDIKLNGETSLKLPKKNMSVRFRGEYGQDTLHYDIYGDGAEGGVTDFTNLLLRAGQDYYHAIIRNELCTELARKANAACIVQRSKYCVLYIDGQYKGIYNLTEKENEAMYAHLAGVSRDSVTVEQPPLGLKDQMNMEVIAFALNNRMADPDNYAEICNRLDVDSLIDWLILEGFFANADLKYGNVRYCRSTENDGKWRVMFYDLDATFHDLEQNYGNLLSNWAADRQVARLINALLRNPDFKDRLLTRAAELLKGPLSNESVLEEIDILAAQIDSEVDRDYTRMEMDKASWEWNIQWVKNFITKNNWAQHSIDALCRYLGVSGAEKEKYFGD